MRDAHTRSQQKATLSLSPRRPALHKTARAVYHDGGWNTVYLLCSLCLVRHTSLQVGRFHMIMADPTIDAPEVPILLLGDAEVGKSTFLS